MMLKIEFSIKLKQITAAKMRYVFFILMLCSKIYCFGQNNLNCKINNDSKYSRLEILDSICKRLNKMNEFYDIGMRNKFVINSENKYNFFIYDISDLENKTPNKNGTCIEFVDNHIYHIAALRSSFKVSIILALINGKAYYFEGLNCSKKIDNIEDVVAFVESNFKDVTEDLINRVKKYYKYDLSFFVDAMGKVSRCEDL